MLRTEVIEKAYRKALKLLDDSPWSDGVDACMCQDCVTKRAQEAALVAYRVCYPQLRFLPLKFVKSLSSSHRYFRPQTIVRELSELRAKRPLDSSRMYEGPYHYCRWCGSFQSEEEMKKRNGQFLCRHCWGPTYTCQECGNIHELSRQSSRLRRADRSRVDYICQDCAKKHVFCSSCGKLEFTDLSISLAETRNDQGDFVVRKYCRVCFAEGLRDCAGCQGETHNSVATIKSGRFYCPVCVEEGLGIMPYNYKPLRPYFRKGPAEGKVTKDAFHMGFELEIGPRYSFLTAEVMAHMVKEHVGRNKIYAMEDGSIRSAVGEMGMELASHPFTWEYYKKVGYKDWDKMCLFLKKQGWSGGYNGLGIHIHTTKAAWGTHQIYKLLKFIDLNKHFVQAIAQRGHTAYCRYENLGYGRSVATAKNKHQLESEHHYDAINFNNGDTATPAKTIEFRIFQSSIEPLYFHKNIEFTHACYQFTRLKSAKSMVESEFVLFVQQHQRKYPCLAEFMKGI